MKKFIIKEVEVKCKIIRKPIKNLYMEIKDDFVEIRCNKFVSDEFIKKFILKHVDHIIEKQKSANYYYLFGKKLEKNGIDEKEIYKDKLPEIILPIVENYAKKMNLYPAKISFRFNKSRWGSCSYKNSISFNYYLAKLPIELIEYVVVHELAHIKHKNHGRDFWALVEKYLPDVKERRKNLRKFEKII
jgi:predicted metal-dependent hydrolase